MQERAAEQAVLKVPGEANQQRRRTKQKLKQTAGNRLPARRSLHCKCTQQPHQSQCKPKILDDVSGIETHITIIGATRFLGELLLFGGKEVDSKPTEQQEKTSQPNHQR